MRIISRFLLGITVCLSLCFTTVRAAELLTIGSTAPELNVEHWLSHGDGKFEAVTKFEKGKVYVVEFWATWCGPCIASMPHIAELQSHFVDKGVQIVSISDEELETVTEFLKKPVRGSEDKEQTYAKLTSAYCLTTDPDRSTHEAYMEAAAQNGIPTAFVVGKDSKIDWIGHPMEIDPVLSAVVDGTWDREAFKEKMIREQEAEKRMQELYAKVQSGELDGALKDLDALLTEDSKNVQLQLFKLQLLMMAEKPDAAADQATNVFAILESSPNMVNQVAWRIYETAAEGSIETGRLTQCALEAAAKAAAAADASEKGSILDTVAHLQHLNGDIKAAIATEEEALKLATEREREFVANYLEELRSAAQSPKASSEEDK
ncbi:MAG: redoxin domain-containing protein [Planctomycetales bacterium]|nr:redoxin domain-containing protein [Planctomycetales bacterium]